MDDITCKVCNQSFIGPLLLQCKHPICGKCASGLLSNLSDTSLTSKNKQDEEANGDDNMKMFDISCPVCHEKTTLVSTQDISNLTRDTQLAEQAKDPHKPEAILLHLKVYCPHVVYKRVQKVFDQKGTQLDLYCCRPGDNGAIALAKMFPHLTQLQELNMEFNNIGHTGATAIASTISKLTQLQVLYLHNNHIGSSGATAIANSISNLTQLRELNFGNIEMGDSGATAIANTISKLTQLRKLLLNTNQIRNSGAIAIANALSKLTQLQQLFLCDNQMGDSGAIAISNAVSNFPQLNFLALYDNYDINASVRQQLQQQFGDRLDIEDRSLI